MKHNRRIVFIIAFGVCSRDDEVVFSWCRNSLVSDEYFVNNAIECGNSQVRGTIYIYIKK